jgi:tetratricopeptide (TPR) repeat protein
MSTTSSSKFSDPAPIAKWERFQCRRIDDKKQPFIVCWRILCYIHSDLRKFAYIIRPALSCLPLIWVLAGCRGNVRQRSADADRLFAAANAAFSGGQYERARQSLTEAIDLNRSMERDSAYGADYALLAHVQRSLGEYDSALADYKTAAEQFRLLGDKESERGMRIELARLYLDAEEFPFAATLGADAAANAEFFHNMRHRDEALLISARANIRLERHEETLKILGELDTIDRAYNNGQNLEEIFKLRVETYAAQHQPGLLRRAFADFLSSSRAPGGVIQPASAYFIMGQVYAAMGHPDTALRYFSQALTFLNGHGDRSVEERVLMSLGNIAYRTRHFDQAKRYFGDALAIARRTEDALSQQSLDLALAACEWYSSGSPGENVGACQQRFSTIDSACRQGGFPVGQAASMLLLGECAEFRQDFAAARQLYDEALPILESNAWTLAGDVPALEVVHAVIDGRSGGWYDGPLRLSLGQEHVTEAFALAERKNLADIVDFFSRLTLDSPDAKLRELFAKMRWDMNAVRLLQSDLIRSASKEQGRDSSHCRLLMRVSDERAKKIEEVVRDIETLNPNYRWLISRKTIALKDAQAALPPSAVLVEYVPLGTALYSIIVTHDSSFIRKQNINRQVLLSMVEEYCRLIGDPRLNTYTPSFDEWAVIDRINELSPALYNILLAPIMPLIGNASTLYLVPPEEFHWLPIHTLRPPGSRSPGTIFENIDISYLPSAAALFFQHTEEHRIQTVVGFGHQGRTAWDVEYELKDIRSFYDKARMIFDTSAVPYNLNRSACDLLHVGAEFVLDTVIPDNSFVFLSDGRTSDGVRAAPLGEFLGSAPPVPIVFSNISPVAGGLARYVPLGLLANGSPTVIATMWQGERKAKKYFGEMLYTNLLTGTLPSQAYRQAMIAMTRRDESSPLHRRGLYFRFGK